MTARPRMRTESAIQRARREISVISVLRSLGMEVDQPPEGTSYKTWCPFGWSHPDGGARRTMRVYAENQAYCFTCQVVLDPVSTASIAWGVTKTEAAKKLLAQAGLSTEPGALEPPAPQVDRPALCAALRTWARRVGVVGADGRPVASAADTWTRAMHLVESVDSESDAEAWLMGCKHALSIQMGEHVEQG